MNGCLRVLKNVGDKSSDSDLLLLASLPCDTEAVNSHNLLKRWSKSNYKNNK